MALVANACPENVRLASPADEEQLMGLLRLRHGEDGLGNFDETAVRATVKRGIARDWSYIGIIKDKNIVVASIGLYIGGFWYSNDSHITDFWNFVLPEYRKSTHAKNLLLFAKWVSDQLGRPLVMAKINNELTQQLIHLYERQLPASGSLFIYNAGMQKGAA